MRCKGLLLALGFVCAAGLVASWPSSACWAVESPEIKLLTREVSLGKLERGKIDTSVVASSDKRHVAYAMKRGKKKLVVVDGVEGKEYDGVMDDPPVFSPDSKHVLYAA
jgi:hypothetical protein